MSTSGFNRHSVDSILNFANQLTGKSLDEAVTLPGQVENAKNKGDLGRLVETHFFGINPSNKQVDFAEAGLELKVTGLKKRKDGLFVAKERLVLSRINFQNIVNEDWETSYLYLKCNLMLILFYHFNRELPRIQQKFVLPPLLYRISEWDEAELRSDWELIRSKVAAGLAHELSESDTVFLGACRKGAGGPAEALNEQPNSLIRAKSRAYSFKVSYLNRIIQRHQEPESLEELEPGLRFEDSILAKFDPFLNSSVDELSRLTGYYKSGPLHKGFLAGLTRRLLGTEKRNLPEFDENAIEMKTVRLKANGEPAEGMSFPKFDFLEIVKQDWEESEFFEKVERKFLFVVFAYGVNGELSLNRVFFWNMPYEDRLEAEAVWVTTKKLVAESSSAFPKESQTRVAHVRPHGARGSDKLPLPDGTHHAKQSFWLNRKYIASVVSAAST